MAFLCYNQEIIASHKHSSPAGKERLYAGLLPTLLPWYFMEMPMAIVRAYGSYFYALSEIFSLPFLLKTLFSPWKSITDRYPAHGLDLNKIVEAFVLNCFSRFVGMVLRILTMIVGVVVQILCFAAFSTFFALWMIFPVLLPSGLLWIAHLLL